MGHIVLAIKTFIIGFSVSIPLGPVGIFCARLIFEHGRIAGIVAGIGIALADVVYALAAHAGITVVSESLLEHRTHALAQFLLGQQRLLTIASGCILLFWGIRLLVSRSGSRGTAPALMNVWYILISTFFLTISNPITVFWYLALFTQYAVSAASTTDTLFLAGGIFAGSLAWWTLFSFLIGYLGTGNATVVQYKKLINALSGSIIIACGIYLLISAFL